MSPTTVETKTRPILFGAPMVRAILDDTKTQTRRAIKPQPDDISGPTAFENGIDLWTADYHKPKCIVSKPLKCLYGVPGDRLWVKETYALHVIGDHLPPSCICSDHRIWYRVDGKPEIDWKKGSGEMPDFPGKWRSNRYMPRAVSRITLEVTDVRVERVQDITHLDVYEEGVEPELMPGIDIDIDGSLWDTGVKTIRHAFAELWDSINAKRGLGWSVNPWVWCVTFRRVKP